MTSKRSSEPSPESIARANRQRLAQEEGVRAMADVAREASAIRKNMERLRALRVAKEAEQASLAPADLPDVKKKKRASKRKPAESALVSASARSPEASADIDKS